MTLVNHLHPELLQLEEEVRLDLGKLGESGWEVRELLEHHVFARAVLVDVRHRHAVDVEERSRRRCRTSMDPCASRGRTGRAGGGAVRALESFVVCLAGTTERCSMSGQTFLMASSILCASALETRNIWEYRPPSLTERDSLTSPPVLQIALCATEKISPESTPPMCTST